jgi:hypothetical protein
VARLGDSSGRLGWILSLAIGGFERWVVGRLRDLPTRNSAPNVSSAFQEPLIDEYVGVVERHPLGRRCTVPNPFEQGCGERGMVGQ